MSLSFEEQLILQETQQAFYVRITFFITVVVIILSSLCIYAFSRKVDAVEEKLSIAYSDVENKLTLAYQEAKDEAKNIKSDLVEAREALSEEMNKPIMGRMKEFYHEVVETPEMMLLLMGGVGLVIREYVIRRKKNDKEALEEFKASTLLKVIDGMLAFMIIPALFKNGINAAVMAWKQASVFVNSIRTMLNGFNVVKSYFGQEVEMSIARDDDLEDVNNAVQSVVSRVEVGMKEAIRHHQYLHHDKSKDFFKNIHVCNDKCEYALFAHSHMCHLSQVQIDDLDFLYNCSCQMGTSYHTISTNQIGTTKLKPVIVVANKTHFQCLYADRISKLAQELFDSPLTPSDSWMEIPEMMKGECDCALKSHSERAHLTNRDVDPVWTGAPSPKLKEVLDHSTRGLGGIHKNASWAAMPTVGDYETDDEDDVSAAKNMSWFKKVVRGNASMIKLITFMKRNEHYLIGGSIILLATLFLIMMYNEKRRPYKKESEEVALMVETPLSVVTTEGKGADDRRAALRAKKHHVSHRAKPWWEYANERSQGDSDFSLDWRNRDDDRWDLSAAEQEQIDREDRLLQDARKGYNESEHNDTPDFKKEAEDTMRRQEWCPKGKHCKYIHKQCAYTHDGKSGKKCNNGDKCYYKNSKCLLKHVKDAQQVEHDLKLDYEKKDKQKSIKNHTKQMKKFVPTFYGKKYDLMRESLIAERKEAMHNGNNLTVTSQMIDAVGWCTTDDDQGHNATAMWSGFVASCHVFGEHGTSILAEFFVNGEIQAGTWSKDSGKLITEDTLLFEWHKCLDNEVLKKKQGGGLHASSPKIDEKTMLIVYSSRDNFVLRKYIPEPCRVLSIDKLINAKGVAYTRCTVKNSTDSGFCASPYLNASGHVIGWHNERGVGVNYFIGVDKEVTVRATNSPLNL